MRIVHIDRQTSFTGQVNRTLRFATGLGGRGHEVALIGAPGSQLLERGREHGLDTLEIPMRAEMAWAELFTMRRWLRRARTDVIHAHGAFDHNLCVLAAAGGPARHIVRTKHNHTRLRYGPLSRLNYHRTSKVVAVSEFVRKELIRDGIKERKIVTIHDPIDIGQFTPRPKDPKLLKSLGIRPDEIIIGNLSSLHWRKRIDLIIVAFRILREQMPSARLKLLLVGKRTRWWRKMVKKMQMEDSVVFPGFQRDVPAFLSLFDVYVLPSKQEALGTSILEAMCMERPVVVSGAGGIRESVVPGTGVVLEDPKPPDIARAIADLIRDPAERRRVGQAARARVVEHFPLDRMVDRLEAVYGSL